MYIYLKNIYCTCMILYDPFLMSLFPYMSSQVHLSYGWFHVLGRPELGPQVGKTQGLPGAAGAGGDRRSGRRSSFFDILAFGYGSIPIKIQILVGWTSIYQLFWCELQGYKVLTHWHLGSRAFVKIWCIEFDVRTSILRQWWLNLVTTRMQLDYSSSDGVNTQNRYPLVI
jgi:hypothetical protein